MWPRKRLFIDFSRCIEGDLRARTCILSEEDSHYLRDVLRIKISDEIALFDKHCRGSKQAFLARVEVVGEKVVLGIFQEFDPAIEPQPVHTLVFGLCKGEKNEIVVQKATELGVRRIILWQAARSVVRVKKAAAASRIERLIKISESAAEQSGQSSLPEIRICTTFPGLLETLSLPEGTRRICCSLSSSAVPIHECIEDTAPIAIVVGPEGDLTPEEETSLIDAGFVLANLGPAVLRSETAAIASVSMAQVLWRTKSA